jgi:hypothetical protein
VFTAAVALSGIPLLWAGPMQDSLLRAMTFKMIARPARSYPTLPTPGSSDHPR